MTRRVPLLILFTILTFCVSAQNLINLNPDPNGEPWYVGKLRKLTKEDYRKIEKTPKLKLPDSFKKASLPSMVDNSLNKYFRPIFNQDDGSCGQASGVGYNFTYAINLARDLASNTTQTEYPTHYTYNFLNGGADNGSFYFDGWEVINANGCPNVYTYGGMSRSLISWMSGYDKYYAAMQNRTLEVSTIDVSTEEGLETLKAWMNDELDGSAVGGLANFSAGVSGSFSKTALPIGTPEAGKCVITSWDSDVNHAMTFVGYNDSICYDFNGDGQYTNNIDIDGNGILDLRDFEVGALIMVNSWGRSWGNSGKAYVPYRLLAEPKTNGGIGSSIVHVLKAKAVYAPKATIKATITYPSREKLRITAGVSTNLSATKPDYILDAPIFNFQGGSNFMQGGTTESDKTIEIGLDITPLLSHIVSTQEAKFFLVVIEKESGTLSDGSIGSFSLYDYTNGGVETVCSQTNVPISNNDTTYLSVSKALTFDKVQISTSSLPDAAVGFPYSQTLTATGGTAPYTWDFIINFDEKQETVPFQSITDQQLTPSDNDDGYADVTLPFTFPFYDKTYSKIKVTTDGSILFGEEFEYVRDLAGLMATRAITAYGSDLMVYPSDGDGIWYKSTSDSITIRWKTSKYGDQTFNADFSTTLFPSGLIKFNYGSGITSSTDWVSGVSMGNGTSYNVSSISGATSIEADHCAEFTTQGFPEGLEINDKGIMTFTPKEVDKTWPITVRVKDFNNITSTKILNISATNILTFSCDTLKFESPTTPNPWTTGKDIIITNAYSQTVSIDTIDWNGFGWYIGTTAIAFPYNLNAGESLTLNVKLKSSLTKASGILFDSLSVSTENTTYYLPILINSGIYSTPSYAITFSVTDNLGAVTGATVSIKNYTEALVTNSSGIATVNLVDGTYSYTISYNNHIKSSGTVTVSGATQTINVYLKTTDVGTDANETATVYPNPFSDEISIDGAAGAQISVYNLIGNKVLRIDSSSAKQRIDTKSLPKGIYIITIEKDGGKTIKKLIKS